MSTLPNDARQMQGEDPRGKVFSGLTAVLYAMDTSMSYEVSSLGTVHCANVLAGGLRGKRVLDLGSGHGNTTLMLGQFSPAEIVAVDNSDAMLELMRLVHSDDYVDTRAWLEQREAPAVLGTLYEPTAARLIERRNQFAQCIFRRNSGKLAMHTMSVLELGTASLGLFDAAVGNNMLHWPINQRRAQMHKQYPQRSEEEIREQAISETFAAIASRLKQGGIAVLMEPKDFMFCDTDPRLEAQCEDKTMVSHPLFIRFNALFNEILKQRYGIKRDVPKTTTLFPMSRLPIWCERAGLRLKHILHQENAWFGDKIQALQARMPMWLGQIAIPAADKIAITAEVTDEARRTMTDEEQRAAVFVHYFYICLERM